MHKNTDTIDADFAIPLSEFPNWFRDHIAGWAYPIYHHGKTLEEMPRESDYELYAEKIGVKSHVIYNLMQYATEDIPAEVLKNLGFAISTEIVPVIRKERVTCLVKDKVLTKLNEEGDA